MEKPKAQRLLIHCDRLALEARRFLTGPDLLTCSELIYSAAENLLHFIDAINSNDHPGESDNTLSLVEEQLKFADAYHRQVRPLACQRHYFHGMIKGFLFLFLVVAFAAVLLVLFLDGSGLAQIMGQIKPGPFITSLIGGGLGAIVSVMWRMSYGNLDFKDIAGQTALRRVGAFRPIIGALFGAVIFALVESNLIPFVHASQNEAELLFFFALGFVAGFSERWAPDMLSVATGRNSSGNSSQNQEQSWQPPFQATNTYLERTNSKNGGLATACLQGECKIRRSDEARSPGE